MFHDLQSELQRAVSCDVRFDAVTRQLYSTDASMYQVQPLGVVLPRHDEDLQAVMECAHRHVTPVLPRGGGTSLAGQTVGEALVLDMSKHMHRILDVNTEEAWVRVQPGVVQEQLNRYLAPMGYAFGPDTATSNRATIGGMSGNNSAGAHSVIYGKTVDHVIEIEALLSDGSSATFGPLDTAGLEAKLRSEGLQGHIYREVLRIAREQREEIVARYPKLMRRVSGYNLDELLKGPLPNLASLLVGSEGTLALAKALKLRIVPLPKAKALLVIHFEDMIQAVEADALILEHKPSAAELVDRRILHEAMGSPVFKGKTGFIEGDPGAIVIVEFFGESAAELRPRLQRLEDDLRHQHMGYAYVRATEPALQTQVWNLRKGGLGLLMGTRTSAKPLAFVEDTAVDPARLPGFLAAFKEIVERHGTDAGYYGHSSVGCLHIRPFIDLKNAGDVDKMMSIFNEIVELVQEYGGALSGEHGDGLARSWLNERLFGSKLYGAFQEVKTAFDPAGIMNPGKIVNAPPPTENLRYGPDYASRPLETVLDFSREGGFGFAVEMCNGNGQCRKLDAGTMCPSFQVTRDDRHSPRGRANALRAYIAGQVDLAGLTSAEMYRVMDLCLACKACRTECPSNVDVAKMKYEFLHHYHQAHGVPLRTRLFAGLDGMNRTGTALAPLSNWLMHLPGRRLAQSLLGIAPGRTLPRFARKRFSRWFSKRTAPAGQAGAREVILFHDTFMEYNHPELGRAAVAVLEAAGYRVRLVPRKCCGRPMISKGLLGAARENARHNVALLAPDAARGVPIVGVEPSCILTLREDYPELLPGAETAQVAAQAVTIDEFLQRAIAEGRLSFPAAVGATKRHVLLHGHCHQKALVGTAPTLAVLRSLPGVTAEEIDAGCCGMAGSFGYEKEHYTISLDIGEQRLFPAVRAAGATDLIVADGISCRQQIAHGTHRRARHLVELVAEALGVSAPVH